MFERFKTTDQLKVSDEEIAQAAIEFVTIDHQRKNKQRERREAMSGSRCEFAVLPVDHEKGRLEPDDACFRRFRAQELSKSSFCARCADIDERSLEVKQLAAARNGKLRRLRNLVRKREEANAVGLQQ